MQSPQFHRIAHTLIVHNIKPNVEDTNNICNTNIVLQLTKLYNKTKYYLICVNRFQMLNRNFFDNRLRNRLQQDYNIFFHLVKIYLYVILYFKEFCVMFLEMLQGFYTLYSVCFIMYHFLHPQHIKREENPFYKNKIIYEYFTKAFIFIYEKISANKPFRNDVEIYHRIFPT